MRLQTLSRHFSRKVVSQPSQPISPKVFAGRARPFVSRNSTQSKINFDPKIDKLIVRSYRDISWLKTSIGFRNRGAFSIGAVFSALGTYGGLKGLPFALEFGKSFFTRDFGLRHYPGLFIGSVIALGAVALTLVAALWIPFLLISAFFKKSAKMGDVTLTQNQMEVLGPAIEVYRRAVHLHRFANETPTPILQFQAAIKKMINEGSFVPTTFQDLADTIAKLPPPVDQWQHGKIA